MAPKNILMAGAKLTRELAFLQSLAMAPENMLMALWEYAN
jgi:hypothetical protein